MSSAICFNLDKSKILSSDNGLKEWEAFVPRFPKLDGYLFEKCQLSEYNVCGAVLKNKV